MITLLSLLLLLLLLLSLLLYSKSYNNGIIITKKTSSLLMNNNNNNNNNYIITKDGKYQNTLVSIDRMNLFDIYHVVELSTDQFRNRCEDEYEVNQLKFECFMLFLPKILFPQLMGHSLISIKAPNNNTTTMSNDIIGFVDVSLQPCDGTLKSLRNLPLFVRKLLYPNNNDDNDNSNSLLQPYLCNLLVAPAFRQLGLGKLLISECEKEGTSTAHTIVTIIHISTITTATTTSTTSATITITTITNNTKLITLLLAKLWGYKKLHLHVEKSSSQVLGLYLNLKFDPISDSGNIIFMKKDLEA